MINHTVEYIHVEIPFMNFRSARIKDGGKVVFNLPMLSDIQPLTYLTYDVKTPGSRISPVHCFISSNKARDT